MNKKLTRDIEKKLTKLQELLENIREAQVIEPDDPDTWDNDTLYNLIEELKEAISLLEDKKAKGEDDYGDPIILEAGICSLVEEYQSEQEDDDE